MYGIVINTLRLKEFFYQDCDGRSRELYPLELMKITNLVEQYIIQICSLRQSVTDYLSKFGVPPDEFDSDLFYLSYLTRDTDWEKEIPHISGVQMDEPKDVVMGWVDPDTYDEDDPLTWYWEEERGSDFSDYEEVDEMNVIIEKISLFQDDHSIPSESVNKLIIEIGGLILNLDSDST